MPLHCLSDQLRSFVSIWFEPLQVQEKIAALHERTARATQREYVMRLRALLENLLRFVSTGEEGALRRQQRPRVRSMAAMLSIMPMGT